MRIVVQAKPSSRQEQVEKLDLPAQAGEMNFKVSVKELPVQGRANAAIVRALAEYFKVAPSRVRIISGYTSRLKVVEIV